MEGPEHVPDKAKWHAQLSGLLSNLDAVGEGEGGRPCGQSAAGGTSSPLISLDDLDKDLAWQEYISNGQQVRRIGGQCYLLYAIFR